MNLNELKAALASGRVAPTYLITGSEEYLADCAVKAILERTLSPDECTLNLAVHQGREVSDLLDDLFNPPMFAKWRVTVVHSADQLGEHPLKAVGRFVANPPSDSCLIMVALEADRRRKLFKVVAGKTELIQCDPLKARELALWIEEYVRLQGKTIRREVIGRLTALSRSGLRELAGELDRLIMLTGDAETIGLEQFEVFGEGSFEMERWRLGDAIGAGDAAVALKVVNNLHYWGFKPTQLIGDLTRMFQSLWLIKWFLTNRRPTQIASHTKLHPFVLDKYTSIARSTSAKGIENGLLRLLEADLNIKRGQSDGEIEMALLVGDLTGYIKGEGRGN